MPRIYTAQTLASEWGCSAQHVRNLIRAGKLDAIRIGEKLIRITEDAVREYESRNAISASSGESSQPASDDEPPRGVSPYARLIRA
ncbi:helix-turn-helix domain-containing protein [Azorhizobium oxalatiphilum]|uniref:helix-turn-helix domain-containing protein n=1 Tax=Azorhizobium oxalatiphilum TaxID=980631 RepID=UPI00166CF2A2